LRVEELLDRHLDAKRQHKLVNRLDLNAGHAATDQHVQLLLPLRIGVRATRVADQRLAHGEVVLVVGEHVCLHGRLELILVVYLELLRVAVEDRDDHARPQHCLRGRFAATRGQHQTQVLRVGARESQIVRAVDRNCGVEGHQPLEAIVATAVLGPLMVPTTAKQVDVAS
jgi:hypothetical protein